MRKQKKITLTMDNEFSLYGIQTYAPSYKLIYYLNKKINTSFIRNDDIYLIENDFKIYLEKYSHFDINNEENWTLVSNESRNYKIKTNNLSLFRNSPYELTYLIPEYKMFNYILKIDNELPKKNFTLKFNNIDVINLFTQINKTVINNKEKLIF